MWYNHVKPPHTADKGKEESHDEEQSDVAPGETAGIGNLAAEKLKEAIVTGQSAEVDAVTGASVTGKAVKEAAGKCIAQAMGVPFAEETAQAAVEAPKTKWYDEAYFAKPAPITDIIIKRNADGCAFDRAAINLGHHVGARNSEVLPGVFPCKSEEEFYSVYMKPALESGKLKQADTIEELAKLLGMDDEAAAACVKSVERYNELCDKGIDEDEAIEGLYVVGNDMGLLQQQLSAAVRRHHAGQDDLFRAPGRAARCDGHD